jgi:hypothetical protein
MLKSSVNERPVCSKCTMNMVVSNGFGLDRDVQTFECLRCGHIELPTSKRQPIRKIG